MDWDTVKDRPVNSVWTMEELEQCFEVIQGGVALPGRKPGFCIVAAVRHNSRQREGAEIHVLAEYESARIGDLLRQCRALGPQYDLDPDRSFQWASDYEHKGALAIIDDLNAEWDGRRKSARNYLCLAPARILDMQQGAYDFMLSRLDDCLKPDHKRLFLHRSRVAEYMPGIAPDDVPDLVFGDVPAIEALAFVVDALQEWLECRPTGPVGRNTSPYRNWARFNRSGRR